MGKIAPGERDAGGRRHGDHMDGVIGRAAGGEKADDAIDDGALIDDAADRRVVIAERGDGQRALRWRGASIHRADRVLGLTKVEPGTWRPMISMSIWLELAVP